MTKNFFIGIIAVFIFVLGYVSEDFVALYETRPNQYPPYGKEVVDVNGTKFMRDINCLLYTSPSPRDRYGSRMPSSA